ncbi:MAG TPA: DUF669 domain-containing protein [Bryobacteraceae bacterium]|jgi:hypothetical protein
MSDMTYDPTLDTPVDLSRFDDDYRKAKQGEVPPPFKPVPDGRYQVIVENVELTKTRTTGNPMLKWRMRIAGPTMADRILWKNQILTERSMAFVAREFAVCGLNMESLSELPSRLAGLTNLRLEVTKKSRPERPDDVYFDRNLTAVPATLAASAGGPSAEYDQADRSVIYDEDVNDDLPF